MTLSLAQEHVTVIYGVLFFAIISFNYIYLRRRNSRYKEKRLVQKIRRQIIRLTEDYAMTADKFLKMRFRSFGGRGQPLISNMYDFSGVYILYNSTKGMYYIGQGKAVLRRVSNHFTGKGNGDVYADYKYGDKFLITLIDYNRSGYNSINALEREAISEFSSFARVYNKTRGNF